ncbi:MAG: hypothetical protein LBP78_08530 [Acidaminococcales bacterium]|jgi:hypothetical protein|nr:hypothetical protein [Acidaminococcales bacterium]
MREYFCVRIIVIIAVLQLASLLKIYDFRLLTAALGAILITLAYGIIGAGFKKMAAVFLLTGLCINIYKEQPLTVWISGINYMLNIGAILVIMQIFSIPIKLGGYADSLRYLILRAFDNERAIYIFTMLVTHLFSSFLLFGTIPVMLSLVGAPLKSIVKDYRQFAATALSRSYSMVVMWAPGAVNILLVLTATGARWADMFFLGASLSALGIFLSYFMQRGKLSRERLKKEDNPQDDRASAGKAVRQMALALFIVVILILLIMFFEYLGVGDNTSRVMLAGLILSLCWLSVFIRSPEIKGALDGYLKVELIKTVDLFVLYLSIGIFSKALEAAGFLSLLYPYAGAAAEHAGIFLLPAVSFTVFLLSLLGLHPYVMLVVFGNLLTSLHLPIKPAVIATALVFGSSIAYMASPFAGIVLTCAKYLDVAPHRIGLYWNGLFGLVYFILGSMIIMLAGIL